MLLIGFPLEDIPRKVTSQSFLRQIIMVGDCYVKSFWQSPLHLMNVRSTISTLGLVFFYHLQVWILFLISISKLAVVNQIGDL